MTGSDFFLPSTRQSLEVLQGDIMDSINFTAYKDYLNENPFSFDLQEVFDNLTALAQLFSANMVCNTCAGYALSSIIVILISDGCCGKLHPGSSK